MTVLEVKALETLIRVDAELTKLGEDGKVIIDGVEYQWVGVNTPKNQLD